MSIELRLLIARIGFGVLLTLLLGLLFVLLNRSSSDGGSGR